ncbi:MAG: adenosylmethionine--8-amino-7-oxononanoate transaminase [Planctomycetota bacterium]|nr:MAG: adenosylmethionine--8-amino-7-oxononanoate transaminase [Planctomycetota bacterium]
MGRRHDFDDLDSLLKYDREHLWHPYTSIVNPLPVFPVDSVDGVRIRLSDGRELIDGMASWWSAIHGYNHPRLVAALQDQAARMSHVMFGGLTHRPAVELAEYLVHISPEGLEKVFLADSGSVSVEVAMKMAMQYQFARGLAGKNRFLTIQSGYHGDTFHAMSVCDPVTGMHHIYSGSLPEYFFAERPAAKFDEDWDPAALVSINTLIEEHRDLICAVILEPIVQGAGGMYFYHPRYLAELRRLCTENDVLLIADEIATGFGRSGKLFACNHANVTPDIMCLGKALTGGCMTLAAVLATAEVGETISSAAPGVFMHGPTFMGNPLACRVAVESIDLLFESGWEANVKRLEQGLRTGLARCGDFAGVADVRILGGIGVVEMERPVSLERAQQDFVERGVWVRPFGKLVYVMPPYCMDDDDLGLLTSAICDVVNVHGEM